MHQSKMDGWLRWRVIAAAQPALYAGSVPSLIAAWKYSPYLSIKNGSAATTLSPAVSDRYAAGPGSFGAPLRIPGVKTENTAKKRRKDERNGREKKSAGCRSIIEGAAVHHRQLGRDEDPDLVQSIVELRRQKV